eukprot:1160273-Pelagomonas_calceolata.AAC.1
MEALGSLAPVISAQDPKLIHKTLTMSVRDTRHEELCTGVVSALDPGLVHSSVHNGRSTVVSMDMITSDLALPVRKTKIAATIGPASRSPETLHALVAAGMDMARFKFSHATPTTHAETLTNLRQIASEAGRCIATIMDLQGPEVRTSYLVDRANGNARIARIELHAGERVAIYGTDDLTEDMKCLIFTYALKLTFVHHASCCMCKGLHTLSSEPATLFLFGQWHGSVLNAPPPSLKLFICNHASAAHTSK